jgi:ppGpp synthetase/RelA/SpoT-type nucleotidyltranferase
MEIEILKQEYDSIRSIAQRLANSIADQIRELVSTQCITLAVPLEYRVKEWSSIQDKVERNHLDLEAMTELSDLIGIRIILLFQRDLSRMCSAITNTFIIVSQEDTSERLDEARFGYRSLHYNFKLPEAWLTMPTFRNCGRFIIEAQIRTLAQHLWAAHRTSYSTSKNITFLLPFDGPFIEYQLCWKPLTSSSSVFSKKEIPM